MIWFMLGAAQAACTIFSGAMVHLPDGPERGVTVVIDDDQIVAVGQALESVQVSVDNQGSVVESTWNGRSCGYETVSGKHVTAGLFEANTDLGLVEVDLEKNSVNSDAGGDPIRAGHRAAEGYDPLSSLVKIQRAYGITHAISRPRGGLVSGTAAQVQLAGIGRSEAVLDGDVAVFADLHAGESRAATLSALEEVLEDAQDFERNRDAFDRGDRRPYAEGAGRQDLEALGPVVRGEIPLVVRADRAADIESLLGLAERQQVRLVIEGAAEGWIHADALASAKVPVIVDPLRYRPGSFSQVHARPDNAKRLLDAGVDVILSSFSSHNARNLRQVAGNAVRDGMDRVDALNAITTTPARVFGADDYGALAVGQNASLVVWSGDPLALSSRVDGLYIDGQRVSLEHRQKALFERYRTLPGHPASFTLE